MVVIEPFHLLTANVAQIESTRASYEAHASKHAEDILAAAAAKPAAAGVQLTTRTVLHDQPFDAIIRTAQEEGCDVITIASHGRPRHGRAGARQPDHRGADPLGDPGSRAALRTARRPRHCPSPAARRGAEHG